MVKKYILIFIIIYFLLNLLIPFSKLGSSEQISSNPKIKNNAPTEFHVKVNSTPWYVDLYDIYEKSNNSLLFTIWNRENWGLIYQSKNITVSIETNNTIHFIIKPNITGADIIQINATESGEFSTIHNLKIIIQPINNPPKAKITYPNNGSYLYDNLYDYFIFEGEGDDLDISIGDNLSFEWISDLDGNIGYGSEIKIQSLTVGIHRITFKVTDSYGYNDTDSIVIIFAPNINYPYSNIELTITDTFVLIFQNDLITSNFTISNYGPAEDNLTFEVVKYLEFNGSIEFEFEYVLIRPFETKTINITISIPFSTKVGMYPIDILINSIYYHNYKEFQNFWTDFGTFQIIVIENLSNDNNKLVEKPNWNVGNKWEYSINMDRDQFQHNDYLNGVVNLKIIEDSPKIIEEKEHDTYVMEIESELKMEGDQWYSDDEYASDFDLEGKSFFKKSDLAIITNEMTFNYEVDDISKLNRIYSPPLNKFNFPFKVGDYWKINMNDTEKYENTSNRINKKTYFTTIFRNYNLTFVCLGTEIVSTPAGTFEAYLILEFCELISSKYNWDDDFFSRNTRGRLIDVGGIHEGSFFINYYSSNVGYIIKQDAFEHKYSYNEYDERYYYWQRNNMFELISFTIPFIDLNYNKITDNWETKYNITDPNSDEDKDNFTNFDEYINGTSPINPYDNPDNPIDEDKDGMPDTWEKENALNPYDPNDANYDYDKDGFTNFKEYESHTSPRDPDDHPKKPSKNKDNSVFGLGKIGNIDVAYIYASIVISIILILIIAALIIRKRHGKKEKPTEPSRVEKS
jgi:hypothetical protein